MVLFVWIHCLWIAQLATCAYSRDAESTWLSDLHLLDEREDDYRILTIGDPNVGHLGKRQTGPPTQHNISQVVVPSTTGRWTASIEAQLQPSQNDLSTLRCTLSVCAGSVLCGAAKNIGTSWSTFLLKVQLKAREAQTISFVTSCSTPAYVAIRNIVIPGQSAAGLNTTATTTISLPATTAVSTVVALATGNATIGSAESFALVNNCEHSWIAIFGDDDFEHIPPKGMAIVPTRPSERFGAGSFLQTLAEYSQYCATSTKDGPLGCATGILIKRDGAYHPTHPTYLNDKDLSISDFTFQANDVVTLECTWERYRESYPDQASITISVTGCDAVTLTGILRDPQNGWFSVNQAFAGNTVNDITIPYPTRLRLQPWSRNEPEWLDGTYTSVDGSELDKTPWIDYELEDQGPHKFELVCNFTRQDPFVAMTQYIYSTMTIATTTTELDTTTETQWSTFTDTKTSTYTQTEWSTTTNTFISTSTETRYETSTETQFATSTCDASSTDVESSSTSESSTEPTPPPSPSPSPSSPSRPPNPSGENWQIDVFNRCPLGSNFPVIFTQPGIEIDGMAFTQHDSIGIGLKSEIADPTFFPIAGGILCLTSQQTSEQWCGYGAVTAHATMNREVLNVNCPFDAPRPPLPDLTDTIPINVRVGNLCSFYAVQIGCVEVEGAYCLGKGFENIYPPNPTASMQYPMLSPGARLRVRVVGMKRNEWQVQYEGTPTPGPFITQQWQGDWLDLVVPQDATGINLQATCYYY